MITHLEPDILECEVKWALGSITTNKASGGDGIPVELFQTWKDHAVKVLHSICQQIWKTQQWPQDWKMSVFIPGSKKGNAKECSKWSRSVMSNSLRPHGLHCPWNFQARVLEWVAISFSKECSNYHTIALISHASKVMLKILQTRLQQYVNYELPDVEAGFRKGRGTRDQISNICWIIEKQESSRKTCISALLTIPKPLTVWITINCGKFLKRWEYQTTWPASWEMCMQDRKQQLELDVKQQTGSK